MKLIHVNQEGVDMSIVTETKKGEKKVYEVNHKEIRLTNRAGVGVNLYNLYKIPKSEKILRVE